MQSLTLPQLEKIHSGKVRDSFRVDENRRLIAVSDRVSCFNKNLKTLLPRKGEILNTLSNFWFLNTEDILPNHFLKAVDPNVVLVREAQPIRVEMIVRGYLTGSVWRRYEQGERCFSGVTLPDGLKKNHPFPTPVLTPTTKDAFDSPITPEEIVEVGLVDQKNYALMCEKSLELFQFGRELCRQKGVILVDTKYEFGLIDGELTLIDEVHTPDSSRFWPAEAYAQDANSEEWLDKEGIRQWLLQHQVEEADTLPQKLIDHASGRYQTLYEAVLGHPLPPPPKDLEGRIMQNLLRHGLLTKEQSEHQPRARGLA